jgi:protein TonB
MHVSILRSEIEDIAEIRDVAPQLTIVAVPPEDGGRYGEKKRPSLFAIVAIVAAHVLALYALTAFDVISLKKKADPIMIDLVQEQAAPPEIVPPAPPPPKDVPPPPIQPPPLIVSTAQTLAPPPIAIAPPPAVPAPPAPPPPPAPIVPPDIDAATMNNPSPIYPMESRRRHEQGTVRLRVVITVEGRVKEISVAKSSGFDRLDKAALDAVRRWHFRPGTQGGIPVEAVGTLAIPFQLA